MNKAGYIALVNENLPDEGIVTPDLHRETMHTEANSIGELVYANIIEETQSSNTVTGENANFDYIITITKVGRLITIQGNFRCLNTSISSEIFSIIGTDYLPKDNATQEGRAINQSGEPIRVFILDDSFRTGNSTVENELFFFSITYPSKD